MVGGLTDGRGTNPELAAPLQFGVVDLRIRLDLAYDGGRFHGWATQPGLRTVQGELTAAIERVLRVPQPRVVVAGRTDTGVHALGQVCHVDLPGPAWPGGATAARRLNAVLPDDVSVRTAEVAPTGFDARFSALYRRYEYLISDSGRLDPRARGSVYVRRRPLAVPEMDAAAQHLLGEHDFAAFCRARPEASSVRTVLGVGVQRRRDDRDAELIAVGITADAFCHSMVRSVVGALLAVGQGSLTADELREILHARKRVARFSTAPAHGLALMEVGYPADDELAAQAQRARRFRGDPQG
jgi:tRNA pseudouridine38-40 synthase